VPPVKAWVNLGIPEKQLLQCWTGSAFLGHVASEEIYRCGVDFHALPVLKYWANRPALARFSGSGDLPYIQELVW